MSTKALWKSPIYEFRIPAVVDHQGNKMIKEVVVDVTTSAPSFEEPGKTLSRVLTETLDHLKFDKREKIDKVLDFGAGKLRNTVYLLKKKYNVTSVEYEKLSKESLQGQRLLAQAKSYKSHFKELVFPHDFIRSKAKFDIVMLINVLNIMPVPSERLLVLQQCYEKIRKDGFIFWYTQYGDYDQNKRCTAANVLGDGYYIGENRKFKSFYREFSPHEIDEMLMSSGFMLEKTFAVSHNQARLYRKGETNVLKRVLGPTLVQKELNIKRGVSKPAQIEPKIVKRKKNEKYQEPASSILAIENLYSSRLKKIQSGRQAAIEYQKLIMQIVSRVFDKSLRNIRLEENMYDGRKRVDIVATNIDKSGFFGDLSSKSQIKSKYIPIECKNYAYDISGPEFDQIGGRLYSKFGMFGLLVYRNAHDKRAVLKRCQDHLDKDEYIIALDDADITKLLNLRLENKGSEIDDYLDIKFRALVAKKEKE